MADPLVPSGAREQDVTAAIVLVHALLDRLVDTAPSLYAAVRTVLDDRQDAYRERSDLRAALQQARQDTEFQRARADKRVAAYERQALELEGVREQLEQARQERIALIAERTELWEALTGDDDPGWTAALVLDVARRLYDRSIDIHEAEAQLTALDAALQQARDERDWERAGKEALASRLTVLDAALQAFVEWWGDHREGSPNAAYARVDAFVASVRAARPTKET